MNRFLEENAVAVFVVVLIAVLVFGVASETKYDRKRQVACDRVGGTVVPEHGCIKSMERLPFEVSYP